MPEIIGIGTEITECLRIARMIERHGESFLRRIFTPEEIHYCQGRNRTTEHFTGCWAAKEAILKALGTGWRRGLSWQDIEVRRQSSGRPTVRVCGGAKELVERLGVSDLLISIAHCRTHATAYVLAIGRS